ncbi:uncharacterized protein AB9X84_006207 isoform 2-T2 [Acanthopagrus schlegelii]
MSTDIQEPDLSLNVIYNKGDKKNCAETEESQVIIYESEDALKHRQADLWPQKFRPRTQNNLQAVRRRHFTIGSILGVMYLLILAGIFMRYILATSDKQNLAKERDQLSTSLDQARAININLAEELHKLQSRYNISGNNKSRLEAELKKVKDELTDILDMSDKQNLAKERDQLSTSLDQARAININLTEELLKLQSRYNISGNNKSQLEAELKKVKDELTGLMLPFGTRTGT